MPDKNEREKRKQILAELARKQAEEFESGLPIPRAIFAELFDYLDMELGRHDCDDTLKLTEEFLVKKDIPNLNAVTEWLGDHGGNCDCEVLANVEEQFED